MKKLLFIAVSILAAACNQNNNNNSNTGYPSKIEFDLNNVHYAFNGQLSSTNANIGSAWQLNPLDTTRFTINAANTNLQTASFASLPLGSHEISIDSILSPNNKGIIGFVLNTIMYNMWNPNDSILYNLTRNGDTLNGTFSGFLSKSPFVVDGNGDQVLSDSVIITNGTITNVLKF